VAVSISIQTNAAVEVSNRQICRVIAKSDMSDTFSGIPEGHHLREIIRLQQLAMTVGEANREEVSVWREFQGMWHQFLEDFHKMQ